MYTTSAPRVRDEGAAYGPHEVHADRFPAARVLEDLPGAPDDEIPVILARYAVLRYWLLRQEGDGSALTGHAGQTARAYLGSLDDRTHAGSLAALTADEPSPRRVVFAAMLAERAGHVEGAYALYRTGYTAARRHSDLRWAGRFAARIAQLLKQANVDGVALWTRRADRLRQLSNGP